MRTTIDRPNLRLGIAVGSTKTAPLGRCAGDAFSRSVAKSAWPSPVEMILSALEVAGGPDTRDQRRAGRRRYRTRATLQLHSDPEGAPAWILYTRDANARGLGFVTPHLLPLGYGGLLDVETPSGEPARIACTLLRCREISQGWYDGSLYFHRERGDFAFT